MVLKTALTILTLGAIGGSPVSGGQMPPGMTHDQHLKQMQKDAELEHRGADAMGFDQAVTTHHFILARDGGAIEVTVKDPGDEPNRQSIRLHLKEIADQFAAGDFQKPLMTHGEAPDGVAEMTARRSGISYAFESMPEGGRVYIRTTDPTALAAVHRFLQYQIREHKTGDPLTVRQ
jgi:hypothetical protein